MTGPRGPVTLSPFAAPVNACQGPRGARYILPLTGVRRRGRPARRRRSPAPQPRAMRGREQKPAGRCDLCARRIDCGPPRRGKAAGRSRRPGLAAVGSEGRRAATPGGECVGSPPKAEPAPQAWRSLGGGRSAADRAGGADGPTAPTLWGPGRPGAPTPQPSAGCDRGKARAAARLRAWPCGGHGWPALRLAAGKRRRRVDLSRRRCCAAAAAAGG